MDAVLDLLTLLVFLAVVLAVLAARSLSRRNVPDKVVLQRLEKLKGELVGQAIKSSPPLSVDGILKEMENAPFANLPLIGPRIANIWMGISVLGWRQSLPMRVALTALASLIGGVLLGKETPLPLLASLLLTLVFFTVLATLGYRKGWTSTWPNSSRACRKPSTPSPVPLAPACR